ncbi:MAG: metallophosphoesterase [Syntrophobacteraceae bacterium]
MMLRCRRPAPKSIFALLLAAMLLLAGGPGRADTPAGTSHHIVVLGDPHLPGKHLELKEKVIQTVNSWTGVEMVVAVGDICEDRGTNEEYAAAKEFFRKLGKPFYPVPGNHDFIYEDALSSKEKRRKGPPAVRDAKLRKFRETFGLSSLPYSRQVGGYLLVFLSPDQSSHLTEMSDKQIEWLSRELDKNRKTPTIIFFHAPLKDTLPNDGKHYNTPDFIAQPSDKLHGVLAKNPQVFLWVSGHTHTSPKVEGFAGAMNLYDKRVTNIHNTDMNRKAIWTNSLFLYPDKVVVKTYNHAAGAWLPDLERTIRTPAL